jgi:hypothetical protein
VTAVHEVLDEVQSPAVDVRRVLTAVGAGDLRQARARQVGDGAWTPEILLIGTDITDAGHGAAAAAAHLTAPRVDRRSPRNVDDVVVGQVGRVAASVR